MTVKVERNDEVWTVILDRPEVRNAVDRATARQLAEAFREFEADQTARVAVLWGEGNNFCAGADLKAFAQGEGNRVEPEGDGPMGPTRLELSKPVLAAVEGYAVAGGLELALWCDMRIADETAVFGVFCRRWGVPLIDGGTVRLPRVVGMGRAMELILTGRAVHADEALQIGLCNRVVEPGEARNEAEQLARRIAAFPQACMRSDRRSAYRQWGMDESDALAMEFERGQKVVEEAREGAKRFAGGAGRGGRFDES